jgi:hypothetical protein
VRINLEIPQCRLRRPDRLRNAARADQVTSFSGEDDPDPDDPALLDLPRPPR